jgi:hypothetical protein
VETLSVAPVKCRSDASTTPPQLARYNNITATCGPILHNMNINNLKILNESARAASDTPENITYRQDRWYYRTVTGNVGSENTKPGKTAIRYQHKSAEEGRYDQMSQR